MRLTIALATVGCGTSIPDNGRPEARFEASSPATAQVPIILDATSSTDPDGDTLAYRWLID